MRRAIVAFLLALTASCASTPPLREGAAPRFEAARVDRPEVALVLSGGGARGFAHVGVIKVLEEAGLRPDLIVGSSAGAIVGALYASGLTAAELDAAIAQLDASVFTDIEVRGLGLLPGSRGFVRGDRLHRFIDEQARHHHIEDFPLRFAAVATDLATGEPAILNAGDVGMAVRASAAVPGIFTPVQAGSRRLIDGQLSSPVPVEAARRLGAQVVVAVDVIYPPEDASPQTAPGVFLQAFTIAVHRLKHTQTAEADLVLQPDLGHTSGQLSFGDRERLVAAGERAARQALPAIRSAFGKTPS